MNEARFLKKDILYTYDDYSKWNDGFRYELINGVPYLMSPTPSRRHQEISGEIFRQLANFLTGKPCKVYTAPFDVRLYEDNKNKKNDTVLQPDIVVICDKKKLDDKGCAGVPDMIIEILSPSTSSRDLFVKFNKYLDAGVREYWIVHPESKTISAHILTDGKYFVKAYGEIEDGVFETAPVYVLSGCEIILTDVFAEI